MAARASDGDDGGRARRIADFIAGMTDRYALVEHARLFDEPTRRIYVRRRAHSSRERPSPLEHEHLRLHRSPRVLNARKPSAAGVLPAGDRSVARRGRAAARCDARRHGDQCRHGAGEGRRQEAARAGGRRSPTRLRADDLVAKVDVAGPGFINLTLKPAAWTEALRAALRAGADYGKGDVGRGERSTSNTSRPIRPGRCMSATAAARCSATRSRICWPSPATTVTREYYINDAGAQVDVLARSAFLRYREALGEDIGAIPEGLYPGDYLKPVGQALAAEHGRALNQKPEDEWLPMVRAKAIAMMMAMIRDDLAALNVTHDVFFLRALADRSGAAAKVARDDRRLRAAQGVYRGPPAAAEGRAGRGLGGPRADAVSRHRLRRRRRPAADEVGRQLHLFRLRHRLSQIEVRSRLPQPDRRLGRRPRRLRQAHAGGGEGGERRARPSSTSRSSSWCGCCAPASR